MADPESSTTPEEDAPFIDIHYLKTPGFREVSCDGAMGGSTPHGKVWLAFYSERFPLPRVMRHRLKSFEEGGTGIDPEAEATVVEARRGLIRNVEFGVYMSIETATDLHKWLGEYLAEAESQGETE